MGGADWDKGGGVFPAKFARMPVVQANFSENGQRDASAALWYHGEQMLNDFTNI
jgi:hypothetical protein